MTFGGSEIQKTTGMRYIRKLILFSLGSLLLIVTLANGQQPDETKRVLILLAGQMGVPGYVLAEEGMRTAGRQWRYRKRSKAPLPDPVTGWRG